MMSTTYIWQDPKQRRMFSADDLRDLFTLGDDGALDGFTDTVDLFQVRPWSTEQAHPTTL